MRHARTRQLKQRKTKLNKRKIKTCKKCKKSMKNCKKYKCKSRKRRRKRRNKKGGNPFELLQEANNGILNEATSLYNRAMGIESTHPSANPSYRLNN